MIGAGSHVKGLSMAIDGTYQMTGEGMGLQLDGTLELKTSGSALQGTAHILGAAYALDDGTVTGDAFKASVTAPTPMGKMKLKIKGTVDGDKITGSISALMVSATFEGTRI